MITFEDFWNLYPRHVQKKNALEKWNRLSEEKKQLIMEDLPRRKLGDQWTKDGGQYIPHPTTYLNQERWEDEIITAPKILTY